MFYGVPVLRDITTIVLIKYTYIGNVQIFFIHYANGRNYIEHTLSTNSNNLVKNNKRNKNDDMQGIYILLVL